jgi:hypothetical protein
MHFFNFVYLVLFLFHDINDNYFGIEENGKPHVFYISYLYANKIDVLFFLVFS